MLLDQYLYGKAGISGSDQGNEQIAFPINVTGVYDTDTTDPFGNGMLTAIAMGAASFASSANTYTLAEKPSTSFTYNVDKQVSRWIFEGGKVDKMTLKSDSSGFKETYDCQFEHAARSAGAFPTFTTLRPNKIIHQHLTFRIGDLADELTSSDNLSVSAVELSLLNTMKGDQGVSGSRQVIEQLRDGFREVTLKFTIPRYAVDTYLDFRDADTNLQINMSWTNSTYTRQIYVPTCKIKDIKSPVGSAGLLTQEIEIICFRRNTTTSTFDTTTTEEFYVKDTNGRTASPIA
jgi:hypothetical protein